MRLNVDVRFENIARAAASSDRPKMKTVRHGQTVWRRCLWRQPCGRWTSRNRTKTLSTKALPATRQTQNVNRIATHRCKFTLKLSTQYWIKGNCYIAMITRTDREFSLNSKYWGYVHLAIGATAGEAGAIWWMCHHTHALVVTLQRLQINTLWE